MSQVRKIQLLLKWSCRVRVFPRVSMRSHRDTGVRQISSRLVAPAFYIALKSSDSKLDSTFEQREMRNSAMRCGRWSLG